MTVHIQQPDGSALCAHSCVAMALGISLDDAIARIGHRRGTRNHELIRALGPRCKTKRSQRPPADASAFPDPCIVRVRGLKSRHHVALFSGGKVYDPAFACPAPTFAEWYSFVYLAEGGRVVSVFPLEPLPPSDPEPQKWATP